MITSLIVCVRDAEGSVIGAYSRKLKLPFVPTIGMKLKQSSSISLWETTDGNELDPAIKEIVYNIDDNELYCLFEIDQFLKSKYWTRISNFDNNHEFKQLNLHTDFKKFHAESSATYHET